MTTKQRGVKEPAVADRTVAHLLREMRYVRRDDATRVIRLFVEEYILVFWIWSTQSNYLEFGHRCSF
jgi:hypothetical protein